MLVIIVLLLKEHEIFAERSLEIELLVVVLVKEQHAFTESSMAHVAYDCATC